MPPPVAATSWQLSQASANGLFQAHLACTAPPSVGSFQTCTVQLLDADKQPVTDAQVLIDGGMPAHGHGLPTAPVLKSVDSNGNYQIEGLQYSMPGAWLLGFLIKSGQQQDKVVFEFVIGQM